MVGIIFAVYKPGTGAGNVSLGVLLFLLTTLSSAVGAIALKLLSPRSDIRCVTALSLSLGGILLVITSFVLDTQLHRFISLDLARIIGYLALLSALAFTLWNQLIEQNSVNRMAAYRFLIPLFGVLESVIFIPEESLGIGLIIGMILIAISLRYCTQNN